MNRAGFLKRMAMAAVACAFLEVRVPKLGEGAAQLVRVVWPEMVPRRHGVVYARGYLPDYETLDYEQREALVPNPEIHPEFFDYEMRLHGLDPDDPGSYRTLEA